MKIKGISHMIHAYIKVYFL